MVHPLHSKIADDLGDITITSVQRYARRLRLKYRRLAIYWKRRHDNGRAAGYLAAARHVDEWFQLK